MAAPGSIAARQKFLDAYYGASRHVYDLTRKHYLFGRDQALRELLESRWKFLVEIGPGTGRNLRKLHAARPEARFAGLEAAHPMLEHARARCPFADLEHGFAEQADLRRLFGAAPDRILYSYSLSMIPDAATAIARSRRQLASKGELWVVDFADGRDLPRLARAALHRWLRAFHVAPLPETLLDGAREVRFGPGRYYVIARFGSTRGRA